VVAPGDVVLVDFPFSASEPQPYKRRPVLVMAARGTPPDQAIFCVMITGNHRRVRRPGPGDITIPNHSVVGLARPSVIRTRRIWTAEGRDIVRAIGQVETQTLDLVRAEVAALLGLIATSP
jgi:mRNA-degrading endonuclease toxin of MazEF toxin-antitoxin module